MDAVPLKFDGLLALGSLCVIMIVKECVVEYYWYVYVCYYLDDERGEEGFPVAIGTGAGVANLKL